MKNPGGGGLLFVLAAAALVGGKRVHLASLQPPTAPAPALSGVNFVSPESGSVIVACAPLPLKAIIDADELGTSSASISLQWSDTTGGPGSSVVLGSVAAATPGAAWNVTVALTAGPHTIELYATDASSGAESRSSVQISVTADNSSLVDAYNAASADDARANVALLEQLQPQADALALKLNASVTANDAANASAVLAEIELSANEDALQHLSAAVATLKGRVQAQATELEAQTASLEQTHMAATMMGQDIVKLDSDATIAIEQEHYLALSISGAAEQGCVRRRASRAAYLALPRLQR